MTRALVLLAAAALLATSTIAAAEWSGKGSFEPSTSWDRTDGYMFPESDKTPNANRVYFNGFITDGSVVITPESPNSGALESSFTTTSPQPVAILGVWKDCNKDNYIGNLDNVGFEYRAELLLDRSICPVDNRPLSHNDGQWVREFFPIGWANETRIRENGGIPPDNFTIVDPKARVWADKGYPTESLNVACHLFPQPEGTFHSTGGLVAWIDCQSGYTATDTANGVGTVGGVQIGFNDVQNGDQQHSASALNRPIPLGESSDDSHAEVVDCSEPVATTPGQTVADPTGAVPPTRKDADGNVVNVSSAKFYGIQPSPTVNPDGSVLGTENKTERATLQRCGDRPRVGAANSSATYPSYQGAKAQTRADTAYCPENVVDFVVYFKQPSYACEVPYPTTATGRIRPDAEFFSNGPTQRVPQRAPPAPTGDPITDTNNQVQYEVGRAAVDPVVGVENTAFMAIGGYVSQVWQTFDKIQFEFGSNREFAPAPPQYITYYAFVSTTARQAYGLSVPGVDGAYGAEACTAGVGSYDCDRTHWWKDAAGNDIPIPNQVDFHQLNDDETYWGIGDPRTFLNDPFNLRDVDCYDEGVGATRDQGLTPAQLFGQGCQ